MAFCSNCGEKLNEGVSFCSNCGAKVGEVIVAGGHSDSISTSPIKKGVKIECKYDGVLIQVVNEGIGLKETLYINGSLVDQHYTGFNAIWGKTLILRAINYPFKSGEKTIQVFCKSGLISTKFMLCIDDGYIAGDRM